jgi:hypothetical protein
MITYQQFLFKVQEAFNDMENGETPSGGTPLIDREYKLIKSKKKKVKS